MFKGHTIYIINKNWIFDLTEFTGYKVLEVSDNGEILDVQMAFRIEPVGETYVFNKYMSVPVDVVRRSKKIVSEYRKEVYLEDGEHWYS